MLEEYLKDRLQEKKILLMTHIVLGYPSFDASLRLIEVMQEAGVDARVTVGTRRWKSGVSTGLGRT